MQDTNLLVDGHSFLMILREGDTGSATLKFAEELPKGVFYFAVKDFDEQPSSEAPIFKEIEFLGGDLLHIRITEKESDRLSSKTEGNTCPLHSYREYVWTLKFVEIIEYEGGYTSQGAVKTYIPFAARKCPPFRVYPELIEEPNA